MQNRYIEFKWQSIYVALFNKCTLLCDNVSVLSLFPSLSNKRSTTKREMTVNCQT